MISRILALALLLLSPVGAEDPPDAANAAPIAEAYDLVDVGEDRMGPVALVVVTPGIAPQAFVRLGAALEESGFDAWLVSFHSSSPWPSERPEAWLADPVIPQAVEDLRLREPQGMIRWALVGHGMGGVLALMAAPNANPTIAGVLATPLDAAPSAALTWLATQELPPLVIPGEWDPMWNDTSLFEMLWGRSLPPREPMATSLMRSYLSWLLHGPALDLDAIPCPVLVAAGGLDRLAPPESIRVRANTLARGSFVRFGLLRLDLTDPGHGDLLMENHYLRLFALRLVRQLEATP